MGGTGFFAALSCTDPDDGTSTAARTATIDLDPGETVSCTFSNIAPLDLETATNGQDPDTPAGPVVAFGIGVDVVWTYVVTNLADTTITDILLSDDQLGVIACPATVIGPFASMTCSASAPVILGQYANVATVTGRTPLDKVVGDSDPSHYLGATAEIDIEKATNGVDADTQSPPNLIPRGDRGNLDVRGDEQGQPHADERRRDGRCARVHLRDRHPRARRFDDVQRQQRRRRGALRERRPRA